MFKIFYDLLWWIILIIGFPFGIALALVRGESIPLRLGFYRVKHRGGIWIRASSMGETAAAISLAKSIAELGYPIILTATTLSGYRRLEENAPADCDVFHQPIDHPLCMRIAMNRAQPAALAIIESDMWLGMLTAAKNAGAKVFIASGRISHASVRKSRYMPFYFRALWRNIDKIYARTDDDAQLFAAAGADKNKIQIIGDLKLAPQSAHPTDIPKPHKYPIIIAGSIRPEEEELVIGAFIALREKFPEALLVFAPRHSERFEPAAQMLAQKGMKFSRRTADGFFRDGAPVLLLDTMGELREFYEIGDIAIVGGTFSNHGGHNPMEAIYHGVPVVHGPSVANNSVLFNMIDAEGAAMSVPPERLAQKIIALLSDSERLKDMVRQCTEITQNAKNIGKVYADKLVQELAKNSLRAL